MGNTCFKSSNSILKGFSQYVSTTRAVVGDDPKTFLNKPQEQYNGAALEEELDDSVLQRKTCNVKEHYMLGQRLGQGRYGTTFQCIEKKTGKNIACKSITKSELKQNVKDIENVRNEIKIMEYITAAGRQHPNVVSFKAAYEDSTAVHIVMELCSGGELLSRIMKKRHYTEIEAAKVIKIIVTAVEVCHSLGIIHRDLKPENLMFVDTKQDSLLKLIDFGLSTFFKPGQTFNELVGTSFYVAPEVLRKRYGPKVDVWSVGVIMYVLLCGKPPFYGRTDREMIEKILYGEVGFSGHPWPGISRSAKDLVMKMIVRDPERRLSARQVLCHPWVAQVNDGAVGS